MIRAACGYPGWLLEIVTRTKTRFSAQITFPPVPILPHSPAHFLALHFAIERMADEKPVRLTFTAEDGTILVADAFGIPNSKDKCLFLHGGESQKNDEQRHEASSSAGRGLRDSGTDRRAILGNRSCVVGQATLMHTLSELLHGLSLELWVTYPDWQWA